MPVWTTSSVENFTKIIDDLFTRNVVIFMGDSPNDQMKFKVYATNILSPHVVIYEATTDEDREQLVRRYPDLNKSGSIAHGHLLKVT